MWTGLLFTVPVPFDVGYTILVLILKIMYCMEAKNSMVLYVLDSRFLAIGVINRVSGKGLCDSRRRKLVFNSVLNVVPH